MAIELLEKGRVRFWTQVEKCTSGCQVEYVFNDAILNKGEVGIILRKKKYFWLSVHSLQLMGLNYLLSEILNEL